VDARLQDHRVNVELPDEAFMLEAPRGVTIERL
jgi:outer membrane lipoprotein-sorting protein